MRRTIILFILLTVLFSPVYSSYAQGFVPTPVEISTEKVNINGSLFYVHKVLHGQTLYSISAKYGVTQEVIKKQNPALAEGLKTGQILYIPIITTQQETSTAASNISEVQKEKSAVPASAKQKTKYKQYKAKWYETLYDIADKFSVPVEALAHLNGLEPNAQLAKKQVLLIPDSNYRITVVTDADVVAKPEDSAVPTAMEDKLTEDVVNTTLPDNSWYADTPRTYNISLVLPFNASLNTDNANARQTDFYSGVLLAMNDLRKNSSFRKYTLNVVDLNQYPSVDAMLNSGVLKNSELIVGPIVEKDLAPVAEYAKHNRITIVSPMDTKTESLSEDNPYFFLFPAMAESGYEHIVSHMVTEEVSDTSLVSDHNAYTIIYETGAAESEPVRKVKESLYNKGLSYNEFSYGLLEGRGMDTIMRFTLDSLGLNKVFVASESEAFVSDVLRNLHLIQSVNFYKMMVFGLPKWKSYETIELEYFHMLHVHLCLPYYIDYNNSDTKHFVQKYWEVFKAEPTPYSFQGYDITSFFITALDKYGRNYPLHMEEWQKSMLQSNIHFIPSTPYSGFNNVATRDIVFLPGWNMEYR